MDGGSAISGEKGGSIWKKTLEQKRGKCLSLSKEKKEKFSPSICSSVVISWLKEYKKKKKHFKVFPLTLTPVHVPFNLALYIPVDLFSNNNLTSNQVYDKLLNSFSSFSSVVLLVVYYICLRRLDKHTPQDKTTARWTLPISIRG